MKMKIVIRVITICVLSTSWLLAAACSPEEPTPQAPGAETTGSLPAEALSLQPGMSAGWSPRGGSDDLVVARVGSASIYASELRHHMANSGPGTRRTDALKKLVEFELLAQEAHQRGHANSRRVLEVVRREAAKTHLHHVFVENHSRENIREDDYQMAFRRPDVRVRYDHFDAYRAVDAQLICCTGDWRKCKEDKPTLECMTDYQPTAEGAAEWLRERGPFSDPESYKAAIRELRAELPALKWNDLEFWYKQGIPYAEQQGFTKFNEALVETVIALEEGEVSAPVRSYFGWHIAVLFDHVPEKHLTWKDSEFRTEIAEKLYPFAQSRDYMEWLDSLLATADPQYDWEVLAFLDGGGAEKAEPTE